MMKNVKKLLCICLAVAMLVTAVPVLAAGDPAFVVSETTAKPGDTVTITISTQNNPGIIGLQLLVSYDAAVLELKEADEGDFKGVTFGPMTKNPFNLIWIDAIHPDKKTNGVVVTLTFAVKANAPAGKSVISAGYKPENIFNSEWKNIAFKTVAGGVTVGGNGGNAGSNTGSSDTIATEKPLHSVTESNGADRGLGFLFTIPAKGIKTADNGGLDITAATVKYKNTDCQLVRVGALLTTDSTVGTAAKMTRSAAGIIDVAVGAMWDAAAGTYAVRLMNIPDSAVGSTVYARPYYVVNYNGTETVVYGSIDATTYTANRK